MRFITVIGLVFCLIGLVAPMGPVRAISVEDYTDRELAAYFENLEDSEVQELENRYDRQVLQESENMHSLLALARIRLKQQKPNRALGLVRAAALRSDRDDLFHRAGILAYRVGRNQLGRSLFRQTDWNELPIDLVLEQVTIMAENNERQQALNRLSELYDGSRDFSGKERMKIVRTMIQLGDFRSDWYSVEKLRSMVNNEVQLPQSEYLLGYTMMMRAFYLQRQNQNTDRAEQYLQDAVEHFQEVLLEDWEATNAYHTLALIHWYQGKYDAAYSAVEGAVTERGDVPAYHDTLGLIERDRGRKVAAREAWERVLELDPNYTNHPVGRLLRLPPVSERLEDL